MKLYLPYLPELTVLIKVSTISLICYKQTLCCLLAFTRIITLFSFQGAGSNLLQGQIETLRFCKMLQSNLGGDNRNRTDDPLLARQVLSQLSYTPVKEVVGPSGLEPPTSRLSVVRSSQLSYGPVSLALLPACAL